MPAQYTHQLLAEKIFGLLPEDIRQKISDFPAYYLGAQGGDIYYFFRMRQGKYKNLGTRLHNRDVFAVFNAFKKAAERGDASVCSYIAGYITHYAGDTVFHPFVYALVERFAARQPHWKGKRHAYIESDLDAYFIEREKNIPVQEYICPVDDQAMRAKTLSELFGNAFQGKDGFKISKRAIRVAIDRFFRFEHFFQDKRLWKRKFFNGLETFFHVPHVLSVLFRRPEYDRDCLNAAREQWKNPSDSNFVSAEDADALFDRAVRVGTQLIIEFFESVRQGARLSKEVFGKGLLTGIDEEIRPAKKRVISKGK